MKTINSLLTSPEDEYHDFKVQWYSHGNKAELIKDIFSFVNTSHHEDCYLIIGVDDNHNVTGVESDENRLNTQKLTDFLHSLPIANSHTPKVIVEPIKVKNHIIDIITIKDTIDVPVYLDEDKHLKRLNDQSMLDKYLQEKMIRILQSVIRQVIIWLNAFGKKDLA